MISPEDLQVWRDAIGDKVSPGDVLAGKYRLDRLLGAGGMGAVVQAWHLNFDEAVAVKLLLNQVGTSKNALARFEREARAAFKIKSEHAARVMDIGFLDSGSPYIVMELLQGHDLGRELDARGCLPADEAVDYLLQACEAIAEAHTRGIVHRDLKPDNLFLTRGADGRACIKIVDFGISKETAAEPDGGQPQGRQARALTVAGAALGTPIYMAPEQWGAAQTVGPATDIWSLGGILFELLSGKHPFVAGDLPTLFAAVMGSAPVPLRSLVPTAPAPLEAAILCCLEKDPGARFACVGDLAQAIAPFGSARAAQSLERILGVQRTAESMDASTSGERGPGTGGWQPGRPTPATGRSAAPSGPTPSPTGPQRTVLGAPGTAESTATGAQPARGGLAPAVGGALGCGGGQPTQQAWQQTGASQQPVPRSRTPLLAGLLAVLGVGVVGAGLLVLRGWDHESASGAEPPAPGPSGASAVDSAAVAATSARTSSSELAEAAASANASASAAASGQATGPASPASGANNATQPSPIATTTARPHDGAPPTATKSGKGSIFTDM